MGVPSGPRCVSPSGSSPGGRSGDVLANAAKPMCGGDNVVISTVSVVLREAEGAEAMHMWVHEKP